MHAKASCALDFTVWTGISHGMDLDLRLTRQPHAFDADRGTEIAQLFTDQPQAVLPLLVGAGGTAPYLHKLLQKEAAWLPDALLDPEAARDALLTEAKSASVAAPGPELRQLKGRMALLVALMDLGGVWDLETVTQALSDFADAACQTALTSALVTQVARGAIPGQAPQDVASGAGMFVLAMGKMGAGELNYSSDIDLICLFDNTRFGRADLSAARAGFVKATRQMVRSLSDVTSDGYVFRTDLRLRPNPAVTPICLSMETAAQYYESVGRGWERAAFIKARVVAGDIAAGQRFLRRLNPFVWRKHLDFAAVEDTQQMQHAIRDHKGLKGPITLPGHDVKLGRGGIREIEFFAQTRQLIAGGRDPDLRPRGTVSALQALQRKGWIPSETARDLSDHYRFLRTLEHRIQMLRDTQTHAIPRQPEDFARLAALMGEEATTLSAKVFDHLTSVHAMTEAFFAPTPRSVEVPATRVISRDVLDRWLALPALRSHRAKAILDRLRPTLEARLTEAARPEQALAAFEAFLAGLPAGVQILSLFEANPHVIDLVLDVVTISPDLATYLARNASVLDSVIDGGFFAPWPDRDALLHGLQTHLLTFGHDYETQLDAARAWQKDLHFRIGVHLVRGLVDPSQAGRQYAELARTVLKGVWPLVVKDFARRHGPEPGRGAIILGLGALGAGAMHARSDLDLIVVYDADGEEMSQGSKPLASRTYYARLTQALITALQAPMSQGRLYDVDMRLRPSGNKGPVATSLQSFEAYQRQEAWSWEHLALTRAAPLAGPDELMTEVEMFCASVIAAERAPESLARDVVILRERIASAKAPVNWLDVKVGPGSMQDIELTAQTGILLTGHNTRSLSEGLSFFGAELAGELAARHALYWDVRVATMLLSATPPDPTTLSADATSFLLQASRQVSLQDLQDVLAESQRTAAAAISALLATYSAPEAT